MTKSIVTSIRLDWETSEQLKKATHALHRRKNWIIREAIRNYLAQSQVSILAKEARRQSILASKKMTPEEEAWEVGADNTDWEG
jgi:predicted DNA-binding protein